MDLKVKVTSPMLWPAFCISSQSFRISPGGHGVNGVLLEHHHLQRHLGLLLLHLPLHLLWPDLKHALLLSGDLAAAPVVEAVPEAKCPGIDGCHLLLAGDALVAR